MDNMQKAWKVRRGERGNRKKKKEYKRNLESSSFSEISPRVDKSPDSVSQYGSLQEHRIAMNTTALPLR
jgi:hypothetical protein